MQSRKTSALAITAIILLSQAAIAEVSINSKIDFAQSRFEILNSLGHKCNGYLNIYGTEGIDKEPCKKLITNMRGDYLAKAGEACIEVMDWYSANLKTTDRTLKKKLMRGKKACDMSKYEYINKAISKMNNLRELQ